ncbi:MAG: hypothetical protein ACYDH9_21085 [Limisphaerales bacterium]
MKTQDHKTLFALLAALTTVAVASANTLPDASVKSLTKSFAKVPVAELSAKAATTVAQTSAKDREATAVAVVNAVISKHSAVVLPLITSISTTSPEVAAAAAGAAAKLEPKQAILIAVAASKAAPTQAAKIAAAVAKAVPSQAAVIASAVIQTNPAAADSIASAVITAVPLAAQAIAQQNPTLKLTRLMGSSADAVVTSFGGSITITASSFTEGEFAAAHQAPGQVVTIIVGASSERYNSP